MKSVLMKILYLKIASVRHTQANKNTNSNL